MPPSHNLQNRYCTQAQDGYLESSIRKRAGKVPKVKWLEILAMQFMQVDLTVLVAYQLSSLSTSQPRVRTLVHREFLSAANRPLLLATTDIRTPKAQQIANSPSVEIAWWLADAQEQFRICGTAYILPSPDFPSPDDPLTGGTGKLGEKEREDVVDAATSLRDSFSKAGLAGNNYDWESKRVETFEAMSGHMRASWARPVPGTTMNSYDTAKEWPESLPKLSEAEGEEKRLVQRAMRNFALVVIDPLVVDHVELGVVPNQRTLYTKKGDEWQAQILVP